MLWGIGNREIRKDKVNKILDTFDLESIRNAKNDELSIGQRRRVQIAREFMHEMDLLFLDEPTVGLDPSARRQLLDYIKVHVRSGLTVFFTTHIMEEAEYLCDEIAIIDHGKIIAFDTPTGLKQKYGEAKTIELTFKDTPNKSFIDLLKSTIVRKDSKNDDSGNDNSNKNSSIDVIGKHAITITVNNAAGIISEILQHVSRSGLQIESIAINSPSLEEVFLSMVNDDSGEM
jgi:ABC-2 type transport system ATP-binding protein